MELEDVYTTNVSKQNVHLPFTSCGQGVVFERDEKLSALEQTLCSTMTKLVSSDLYMLTNKTSKSSKEPQKIEIVTFEQALSELLTNNENHINI